MKLTRITSVGRTIDLNYPTNRAIALLTLGVIAAGAAFQFFTGHSLTHSGVWGLQTGLAVFLSWALCRELDPDHDLVAFMAAGLALAGSFVWGAGSLGSIFWLIVLLRIVNRTTGLKATLLDSLGVLGLGAWLAWQGNWGYLSVTALGLLADALLGDRNNRQIALAALAAGLGVAVLILSGQIWEKSRASLTMLGIAVGLSAVFMPLIARSGEIYSLVDANRQPLNPRRVQVAQGLALLAGMQAALWSGAEGLAAFQSLWAATTGATLSWLFRLTISRSRD
jgi:hypothetical protein